MNTRVPTVKIVVVEDEESIRKMLIEVIDKLFSGALLPQKTVQFEYGKNAIEALHDYGAHIVITDIGLPDISGVGVIKAVQGNSVVIAISDHAIEREVKTAGADFFISKPFLLQQFSIALIKALAILFTPNH